MDLVPILDRYSNFDIWKIRFQAYATMVYPETSWILENGPIVIKEPNPKYVTPRREGNARNQDDELATVPEFIVKHPEKYTPEDRRRSFLDLVIKERLLQALSDSTVNRVKHLTTAKEIWDKLCEMHEGSEDIKSSKLDIAMAKVNSLKMKEG